MNLTLYSNFSKRKNSTAQPTGSGTVYDVYLKDGCSVENPIFIIEGINLNVNYAYWNGAYYFIDDIILNNNMIYELHCSMDVMATFKSTIGASTQFVERSASDNDPLLIDNLVSAQQDIIQVRAATTQISDSSWSLDTSGTYLLTIFGDSGVNVYGYSSMTGMTGILSNGAYNISQTTLDTLVQNIGLNLLDVSAYVSNVMWIPFALSDLAGVTENVKVSFWTLNNYTAKRITTRSINIAGTISTPTNYYSDFRARVEKFSSYSLYLPGVGTVGISALDAVAMSLTYSLTFDIFTGACTYRIYNSDGTNTRLIGSYTGKLGVQIPYCTMKQDAWGMFQSVINPGHMSGGSYAALASGVAGATLDVCENMLQPAVSINSAVGNMSEIVLRPYISLSVSNYGSKDFVTAVAGRPLYEWRTINTLSGFIKCSAPSLSSIGMGYEKDQINDYMRNGFYYE